MRTFKFYLPALVVMLFVASASALAQQGARRNNTVTARQETKAERKQEKVNEVQKPTNVTNQPVTDQKMRTAGGSQSDRRNGSNSSGSAASSGNYSGGSGSGSGNYSGNSGNSGSSGHSGSNGSVSNNNGGYSGNNGNRPPANGGYSGNNGNRPPANGGYSGSNGNRPPANGGYSGNNGNRPPANGGYNGHNGNSGYRPPVATPPATYPGGYTYPGSRPPLPTVRVYDRAQTVYRTNCSTIVLRTLFRTKEEAYRYVERLLVSSDYTIGTYGNGYSWLQSDVTFIPTPYDWTNPMTHNQFRIKVTFVKSFGYVRVTLSGDWRESMLSSVFSTLRFQPSDSYSTYYAWNVLEDLAESIPHSSLSYR